MAIPDLRFRALIRFALCNWPPTSLARTVAYPDPIGFVQFAVGRSVFDIEHIAGGAAAAEGRVVFAGSAVGARQGEWTHSRRRAKTTAHIWRSRSVPSDRIEPGRRPLRGLVEGCDDGEKCGQLNIPVLV